MALKLMYITNRPDVAAVAEQAGVDRIFVDMEYIGKAERQCGMASVKNHHTVEDVKRLRETVSSAELLVRVNPIHEATDEYCSSKEEIEQVVEAGADIIMLPFFKTVEEVVSFVGYVQKRAKCMLLLETREAAECLDEILKVPGIDEIHIGINDLSISYGKPFMFQLLADGTVETLCLKIRLSGIPFGFGGISSVGSGLLPAEMIIKEHYRIGSTMVILSRSFCNVTPLSDMDEVRSVFDEGVKGIRKLEKEICVHSSYFSDNTELLKERVRIIVEGS